MPRNTGYVLPFTCELFICGISSLVEVCTVLSAILVVVISYVVVLFFVFSAYDYVIPASGKVVALTDLQIALPPGCYGRVGKVLF